MSKKTILHIIDSLSIGGAETLLINANVKLPGFRHVLVHLKEPNVYEGQLSKLPVVCLGFNNWFSLPRAVIKLRKLIEQHQVSVVHSHLYYSTIVARLACPRGVPLISSYHSLLYNPANRAQYSKKLLLLDRLTYCRHHYLLFVSKAVQSLVSRAVGVKGRNEVLYNYVDDKYFADNHCNHREHIPPLRIVMLGNLRPEKNYSTVVQALHQLPSANLTLDIYGDGTQREALRDTIHQHGLAEKITLKGRIEQPDRVLPDYDLYIAASRFEGFGIALAEAMASGLPCLVSDIAAHWEVADDTVVYFDPDDLESLPNKISLLVREPKRMSQMQALSKQRAALFRKRSYMERLGNIYNEVLSDD